MQDADLFRVWNIKILMSALLLLSGCVAYVEERHQYRYESIGHDQETEAFKKCMLRVL